MSRLKMVMEVDHAEVVERHVLRGVGIGFQILSRMEPDDKSKLGIVNADRLILSVIVKTDR